MRAKEFIILEDGEFDPYEPYDLTDPPSNIKAVYEVDKIAAVIEDNCGQMLDAYRRTGEYLYRGIKHALSNG